MLLEGKKNIKIGDLVKKIGGPADGMLAIVVKEGEHDGDLTLVNWLRIRYVANYGHEWVQRQGMKIVTKA